MKLAPTLAAVLILCAVTCGAEPDKAKLGTKRADTLKANVKSFRINFSCEGESGKPYYSLLLSVPELNLKKISPFSLQAKISKDQALKVIDHLANVGSLDRAHKTGKLEKLAQPSYLLSVRAGDLYLSEILGWDLDTLKRLDGLRKALDGDAAKSMDTLLGRLYGHRREWMAGRDQTFAHQASFVSFGEHAQTPVSRRLATSPRRSSAWYQVSLGRSQLL